nr:glutaredoxin 3 [Tissierella sp.]
MDKKIEMYTWSYCPFCQGAKKLLDEKGYKYEETVLDNDEARRKELAEETGQNTVPMIFIDGELIGGFDDLKAMDKAGKL